MVRSSARFFASLPLLVTLLAVAPPALAQAKDGQAKKLEADAMDNDYLATNFDAGSLASVSQGGAVTARSGMTLNPAYPNPATAEASISFSLKNSGETTLDVWNVMGERVANLLSGNAEAGDHTAKLQVATLPAGTYYYTLKSGGETLTRMFTVVR